MGRNELTECKQKAAHGLRLKKNGNGEFLEKAHKKQECAEISAQSLCGYVPLL